MIRILATAFAALAGLAFGSFLNVCLSRWPEGESIVKPRSHCRSCERTLAWWENIPLLSWLGLRGRCRTCNAWIGWRYPLVELVVGTAWGIIGWRLISQIQDVQLATVSQSSSFGFGILGALGLMLFTWMLVGLAVLDAEYLWLADAVTLPGIPLGIAYFIWLSEFTPHNSLTTFYLWKGLGERLAVAAVAALLILLIRWLYKLVRKREGIGLGDAKLMAMLAAWLGLEGALLSFFLGVALGSVAAIITIVRHSKHTSDENWALQKLPLGTFLCIGGIISALYGQPIIDWYLHLSGL